MCSDYPSLPPSSYKYKSRPLGVTSHSVYKRAALLGHSLFTFQSTILHITTFKIFDIVFLGFIVFIVYVLIGLHAIYICEYYLIKHWSTLAQPTLSPCQVIVNYLHIIGIQYKLSMVNPNPGKQVYYKWCPLVRQKLTTNSYRYLGLFTVDAT